MGSWTHFVSLVFTVMLYQVLSIVECMSQCCDEKYNVKFLEVDISWVFIKVLIFQYQISNALLMTTMAQNKGVCCS